jgi:hypothetical protein
MREYQVRICEGLGVKFPGPTRHSRPGRAGDKSGHVRYAAPRIMRYELSDYEWTAIKPMLPNKPRGVRRVNDRHVLNGILGPTFRCAMARPA